MPAATLTLPLSLLHLQHVKNSGSFPLLFATSLTLLIFELTRKFSAPSPIYTFTSYDSLLSLSSWSTSIATYPDARQPILLYSSVDGILLLASDTIASNKRLIFSIEVGSESGLDNPSLTTLHFNPNRRPVILATRPDMPSRGRAGGRAGGRVSLLAALGGAFGINTRDLVGKHRDSRPKPREIRLRGPGRDYGYDESDEDSDYDEVRPVYLGRPGRRSHVNRQMYNSSSRVSDDAMVSDSSSLLTMSGGSNEPAASMISTGRSSRKIDDTRHKSPSVSSETRSSSRLPLNGRYRLSSSGLSQSSHRYNASTEQGPSSRAPMPTNDFLKTVAELEEDYNKRSAATRKAKRQAVSSRTDDKPTRRVLGETTNSGNLQAGDIPSQSEHGDNGKVSSSRD